MTLDFPDSELRAELFGAASANLKLIGEALGVAIQQRGTRLHLRGARAPEAARALRELRERLKEGHEVPPQEILTMLEREARESMKSMRETAPLRAPSRRVHPRTPSQALYAEALRQSPLTFALGAAGSGKTYLAAAAALEALEEGAVSRILLARPALEAGERLGFLPGDMREKVEPYLRPLHEALGDLMPRETAERHMRLGAIEIAPLAFMRGRTFSESFLVLDEAQNCAPEQMMMALTRLGPGSRMVVAGDPLQSDLPRAGRGALQEAADLLGDHPSVRVIHFGEGDSQRHSLVRDILHAYARKGGRLG